jgi:tetratricopeptide (TPR) repeat protein
MRKPILYLAVGIPLFMLLAVVFYNLPPVHERLAWRLDNLAASLQYALDPPEQVVFVPQEKSGGGGGDLATMQAIVAATLGALPSATLSPSPLPTRPGPTATPTSIPTSTSTPTPLPDKVSLKGIVHEYQKWNNCGPANLAMALSFWGWQGDQLDTAAVLKPNSRDKNVMPYEMVDFVQGHTGLKAIARVGGDLQLIKSFLAAGFPVIVEKGFEGPTFDGWMGHYEVVSSYDEAKARFTAQDSYLGANLAVSYADMLAYWQAFNYLYIVVYPPEREAEVLAILGPQAGEAYNYQYAAQIASQEIAAKTGREQFFAWYNRGTNLMYLQDYNGAADAYDQAFALYASLPLKARPWRMLWYQTGPYFAYFFTQRYFDVVSLATNTIDTASEPAIEESFYWRARAFYELYKLEGKQDYLDHAVEDFQTSLKWHPDFAPSLAQLQDIGANQ